MNLLNIHYIMRKESLHLFKKISFMSWICKWSNCVHRVLNTIIKMTKKIDVIHALNFIIIWEMVINAINVLLILFVIIPIYISQKECGDLQWEAIPIFNALDIFNALAISIEPIIQINSLIKIVTALKVRYLLLNIF